MSGANTGLLLGAIAVCAVSSSIAAAGGYLVMGREQTPLLGPGSPGSAPGGSNSNSLSTRTYVDVPLEFRVSSTIKTNTKAGVDNNMGTIGSEGAWSPATDDINQWHQIDTTKLTKISGVVTKGHKNLDKWVKSFKVKYWDNDSLLWVNVDEGKTFIGNDDRDSLRRVLFTEPVVARYIRIYPQEWNTNIALRCGLIMDISPKISNNKRLNIPSTRRSASSQTTGFEADKGLIGATTAWLRASTDTTPWYGMSLATVKSITGIVIQGRNQTTSTTTANQYIKQFTVKYLNDDGEWAELDDNFQFFGTDQDDSTKYVIFNKPVDTDGIRIYVKEHTGDVSGRFDLLGPPTQVSTYAIQGYSF